mmetsp:Transcript_37869/g.104530  ORF Transcript_37869/g.104530 Transcript_37869/m.104530 type:complete len:260 (+) Transcript_37869:144-923(+)
MRASYHVHDTWVMADSALWPRDTSRVARTHVLPSQVIHDSTSLVPSRAPFHSRAYCTVRSLRATYIHAGRLPSRYRDRASLHPCARFSPRNRYTPGKRLANDSLIANEPELYSSGDLWRHARRHTSRCRPSYTGVISTDGGPSSDLAGTIRSSSLRLFGLRAEINWDPRLCTKSLRFSTEDPMSSTEPCRTFVAAVAELLRTLPRKLAAQLKKSGVAPSTWFFVAFSTAASMTSSRLSSIVVTFFLSALPTKVACSMSS